MSLCFYRCLCERHAFDVEIVGADERSRTSDLLITNQLLYQLSYISTSRQFTKSSRCAANWVVLLRYRTNDALVVIARHPLNFVLRAKEYRDALMKRGWLNSQDALLPIGGSATRLLNDERHGISLIHQT